MSQQPRLASTCGGLLEACEIFQHMSLRMPFRALRSRPGQHKLVLQVCWQGQTLRSELSQATCPSCLISSLTKAALPLSARSSRRKRCDSWRKARSKQCQMVLPAPAKTKTAHFLPVVDRLSSPLLHSVRLCRKQRARRAFRLLKSNLRRLLVTEFDSEFRSLTGRRRTLQRCCLQPLTDGHEQR